MLININGDLIMETLYEYDRLLEELLNSDKLKYCYECGTCTGCCPITEMSNGIYKPRNVLLKISLDLKSVIKEKEIWLCASCHKCYRLCPQGIKTPDILIKLRDLSVELGYIDGFIEALDIIKKDIPLPAVALFIGFDPLFGTTDRTKIAEIFKKFIEDYKEGISLVNREDITSDKHVAIIGSGPAGLTSAKYLIKKGYPVTIFESMSEVGGMLRKGIPFFRLPKDIVDIEAEYVKKMGVEIKTNSTITNLDDLKERYDAIFLAIGAQKSKHLGIPGEDLDGVITAIDFLNKANTNDIDIQDKKVVIVGGGNVAMDVARSALRLGAKLVNACCIEDNETMPAYKKEIQAAMIEGTEIKTTLLPTKIFGDNGRVTAIEFIKIILEKSEDTGDIRIIPVKDSEQRLDADIVVLAIGSATDLSFLPAEIIGRNVIDANPLTTETRLPGIFAGGDAIFGPATATEAMLTGKRAAFSIDKYLKGLKDLI